MKKEIEKTKKFDISKFEVLDSNGNVLLKGGFSIVYDESLNLGGKQSTPVMPIANNSVPGCGCTIINVSST